MEFLGAHQTQGQGQEKAAQEGAGFWRVGLAGGHQTEGACQTCAVDCWPENSLEVEEVMRVGSSSSHMELTGKTGWSGQC